MMMMMMSWQWVHHRVESRLCNIWARGTGGCSPPDSGKAIIFWPKTIFFRQKPAAKKWKKIYFWNLL